MPTTTVRILREDRDILWELMDKTGASTGEILHQAIEDYRRKCFLDEANRAFAALKKDPKARKAELEERKAWDAALGDGLKNK